MEIRPWTARSEEHHFRLRWLGRRFVVFFISIFFEFVAERRRNVGKTTCLGTRLAKVELKLITAMFVLGYRHSIVNEAGEATSPLPTPDWNDILYCRPRKGTCRVKYERTAVPL